MSGGHPRCGRHPAAAAAWRCERCACNLCEACAAAVAAGRGEIVVCASCGSMASVITMPRAEVAPFRLQVRAAIRQALGPRALALAAVVTWASQSLAWMGRDWWVAGNALVDGGQRSAPTLAAIVVAVLAIALLPAAMIDSALEQPGRPWLLPWTAPAFEARIGKDIGPIRLAVAAFAVVALGQAMRAPPDFRGDMDLTAHLAISASLRFASVVALAVLASMTGRLVFTRAEELGHGDAGKYDVPVFPEARPRGSRLHQG